MSITPALYLPSLVVSEDDSLVTSQLIDQLRSFEMSNRLKLAYYEGKQRVQHLGISIPPSMRNIEIVVGWAGTTVDVIEERLDWYGWTSEGDDFGLPGVYTDNALDVDSGKVHLDALIYGTSFAVVGAGDAGEPSPLITAQSPRTMTGVWDARKRRLVAALALVESSNGSVTEVTLYRPDYTLTLSRGGAGGWTVVDRDQHNLGRVPVVQFENRARTDIHGRSEITAAVRSYTDQGVRTMLGMEVNREFYSAPQRWAVNASEDQFVDADGNQIPGWQTVMGRVWGIPAPEEGGPEVKVGQFTPASPAPYLDQVRGLSQLLAAEAAIPPSYLGFQTDNPASADAIQRSEARLVKRAERRQVSFGRSWLEVGRLTLLVRDRTLPVDFNTLSAKWREASTPTRSAAADEAVKLVGSGILPPDSSVTLDRIGLTPAEQRQLSADRRRSSGGALLKQVLPAGLMANAERS